MRIQPMSVNVDGQEEAVDIECAYVSFCYEIKLETSGMYKCVLMCNNVQKQFMYILYLARVVDLQVRLKTYLRDPAWERGPVRDAHHFYPRETASGSGRRYRDHPV